LGIKFETFPSFKAYLRPRGFEMDEWRRKLKSLTPEKNRKKKRVGIVWAGNPKHPADHQRSMPWETMKPIVDAHRDRCQFFSLQPGASSTMPEAGNPHVIDLGSHLRDFAVTAAIVANLDLVIAVDTSIVHLAGALGKRVWTMLAYTPDWRWVIGEERTKWYPSMSLFWQKKPGAWEDVINEVNETLGLE
ncbi:MAG TPA: glycosyltransferase family 9 protein, partial [Candidatus Kapabacteria bacterium]|nr:glycosyltransferase family 9 protein [Candidatus Kapabacteria bacterium]